MGRSSSSSRKKKRSKNSSQARSKKGSKIRSRKSTSKKLRRHYSSDEDDDSRSSMSGSDYSSSSDDTKRRSKKYRGRGRKRVVKKKKFKHSYSSESGEDSPRARKRSGSKRKRDYDSKSKSLKKKRKRDDSVSYSSTGSLSCSTCEDDSISSREVGFDRHRRKHGKEERDVGNQKNVESESERSRYRSLSPYCGEHNGNSEYQIEERVLVDNNSRRLRSIIVSLTDSEKRERESNQNEDKEVMYVHDDHEYPSSRSNDSSDSWSKREEAEKRTRLEDEKGHAISDFRTMKNIKSDNISDGDVRDRFDQLGETNEKTSEVSGSVDGVNSDDLEAALRQRALENLKRFRGVVTEKKAKNECDAKQSSFSNDESVRISSAVEEGTELVGLSSSNDVVSTRTHLDKDTASQSQIGENRKNMNTHGSESAPLKQNIDYPISHTTKDGGSIEKVKVGVSATKQKLTRPVFAPQLSETNSTPEEASSESKPRAELLGTISSLAETASRITPTVVLNSNNGGVDANDTTSTSVASEPSSFKPASEETSSDKPQDDAGEGSQFEKKTMSVMRGGEVVQVNYKVYIPKSTPALARRKLKR